MVPRTYAFRKFLWRQASNLLDAHVETMYAAMFDEVGETTALFPVEIRSDTNCLQAQKRFFLTKMATNCLMIGNFELLVKHPIILRKNL